MKSKRLTLSVLFVVAAVANALACTNLIVGKNASADGSTIVSYSADSYGLFGELYHYPAGMHKKGTLIDIHEWDTGKYLGQIEQARQTYNVIGNMNEFQLTIGETTFGGRPELVDTTGIIDYGSLIYLGLQRSRTAREAIKVMTELVQEYGYYSGGESFTIADPNEIWIMEMIGKGPVCAVPYGWLSACPMIVSPLMPTRAAFISQHERQGELYVLPRCHLLCTREGLF